MTLTLGASSGGATLGGTVTVTASGGVATFSNLSISAGGQRLHTMIAGSGSLTGATTASFNITAVATGSGAVIESFETSESWYVVGGSLTASRSTAAAHDGKYGLDMANGNDWIYSSTAATQVNAGDTLSVWLKFSGSADGRAYFGFGATASGTLSLVAAPNTGQLILQQNVNYGFTDLADVNQSYLANHWYRLEVDWSTSGAIIGKLYDSNGSSLLQSVSAATTDITSGAIAFRATGSDKYFDTVTDTRGVNSFTLPPASPVVPVGGGGSGIFGGWSWGYSIASSWPQQRADIPLRIRRRGRRVRLRPRRVTRRRRRLRIRGSSPTGRRDNSCEIRLRFAAITAASPQRASGTTTAVLAGGAGGFPPSTKHRS